MDISSATGLCSVVHLAYFRMIFVEVVQLVYVLFSYGSIEVMFLVFFKHELFMVIRRRLEEEGSVYVDCLAFFITSDFWLHLLEYMKLNMIPEPKVSSSNLAFRNLSKKSCWLPWLVLIVLTSA